MLGCSGLDWISESCTSSPALYHARLAFKPSLFYLSFFDHSGYCRLHVSVPLAIFLCQTMLLGDQRFREPGPRLWSHCNRVHGETKVVGDGPESIGAKRAHEASRASPHNLRV